MLDTDPDPWMRNTTADNLDLLTASPIVEAAGSVEWVAELAASLRAES